MTPQLTSQVAAGVVTVAGIITVMGQCRRPTWWPGRLFARMMNVRHSEVTDWGLGHVSLEQHFTILDVGCGGGRTIGKLAALAGEGKVYGIDYSAASVAVARSANARLIESGRVDIRQGSVSDLPFADGTFDLITAVETHYYWPDPVADLHEVLRVLKPGGRLVVIAETYSGSRFDAFLRPVMKVLRARYLTVEEHRDLLLAAGYAEVAVSTEPGKGWICAVGRRPPRSAGSPA
jgi:SAM-dependent methyltransferase